jgi:hypothetical protein
MGKMARRIGGVILLVATIGLASCQAFLTDVPSISLPIEQQD